MRTCDVQIAKASPALLRHGLVLLRGVLSPRQKTEVVVGLEVEVLAAEEVAGREERITVRVDAERVAGEVGRRMAGGLFEVAEEFDDIVVDAWESIIKMFSIN